MCSCMFIWSRIIIPLYLFHITVLHILYAPDSLMYMHWSHCSRSHARMSATAPALQTRPAVRQMSVRRHTDGMGRLDPF